MDFEQKHKEFATYYHDNYSVLNGAADAYRSLIASLVSSYTLQSVSYRVKDEKECIDKFKRKYLTEIEAVGDEYRIQDYITDIIGVRVVCLYSSDIENIGALLKSHFDAIDETNKSGLLDNTENQFGYRGLHLDLKLNSIRSGLPEYSSFHSFRFEVQIRSIIQDAWSVLDHKIKYKKSIPPELKRSINRLAALFEIADNEFLRIKNETEVLKQAALEASSHIGSSSQSTYLDVFNFQQIIEEKFVGFKCLPDKTDEFVSQIHKMNPIFTISEFKKALDIDLKVVEKYQRYQRSNGNSLSWITQIRHAIYLHDKQTFKDILFQYQRTSIEEWLVHPDNPEELLVKTEEKPLARKPKH
jgi:putative GTP pyrophosphokinase